MSVLLQQNGPLVVVDGTAAPARIKNGIPYGPFRAVAVDAAGAVDHYHQGLPFTAEGRLCVSGDLPARIVNGALPLTASGRISMAQEQIVNLYVNPELAGGGVNTPCNDHTVIFETADYAYEPAPQGVGFFQFHSNTNQVSGRCPQQYSLDTNNPTLEVGERYIISYEIANIGSTGYSACLSITGASDITIVSQDTSLPAGTTRRVSVAFTVDALTYTMNIRTGTGTTSNNVAELLVRYPLLYKTGAGGEFVPVAYNAGIPYNSDGQIIASVQ